MNLRNKNTCSYSQFTVIFYFKKICDISNNIPSKLFITIIYMHVYIVKLTYTALNNTTAGMKTLILI